eukprot:gene4597-4851_t
MPGALDPAFGGQLADADVVRAGQGRMNLRAIRKRVQVESFALLLWQLTQSAAARQQHLHVVEFGCGSGNLVLPLAYLFPSFTFTALDIKPSAVLLLQQRVQQAQLKNVVAVQQRIEDYEVLAQAADYSHVDGHGYPELAAVAKSVVEFDRQLVMLESGYRASLVRLLQPQLTSKSDVLVGAPPCSLLESQQLLSSPSWYGDAAVCTSSGQHGEGADDGNNGSSFGRFTWPWAA